jgi:hypothetical protein
MDKYKRNLKIIGNEIYSYNTLVAKIENGKVYINGYYSITTSKHINYVARIKGYEIIKAY